MKAYTQIPPGTQILIGRAARRRRVLERAICSVFEGWSYEEIIPPIFDYYDVFIKGMGAGTKNRSTGSSTAKATFWRCGRNSLRSSRRLWPRGSRPHPSPSGFITPAKFCASKNPKAEGSGSSRRSESSITAAPERRADVEILLIAVETFQRLGIEEFQINLGSVDFFGGIVDRMELPEEQIAALKDVLNIKDQPGLEALLQKSAAGRTPQKHSARSAASDRRKIRHS